MRRSGVDERNSVYVLFRNPREVVEGSKWCVEFSSAIYPNEKEKENWVFGAPNGNTSN